MRSRYLPMNYFSFFIVFKVHLTLFNQRVLKWFLEAILIFLHSVGLVFDARLFNFLFLPFRKMGKKNY